MAMAQVGRKEKHLTLWLDVWRGLGRLDYWFWGGWVVDQELQVERTRDGVQTSRRQERTNWVCLDDEPVKSQARARQEPHPRAVAPVAPVAPAQESSQGFRSQIWAAGPGLCKPWLVVFIRRYLGTYIPSLPTGKPGGASRPLPGLPPPKHTYTLIGIRYVRTCPAAQRPPPATPELDRQSCFRGIAKDFNQ